MIVNGIENGSKRNRNSQIVPKTSKNCCYNWIPLLANEIVQLSESKHSQQIVEIYLNFTQTFSHLFVFTFGRQFQERINPDVAYCVVFSC